MVESSCAVGRRKSWLNVAVTVKRLGTYVSLPERAYR